MTDYTVLERLVQPDVATLGYFSYGGGFKQLVLIAGRPHVAEMQKPPLNLYALGTKVFIVATRELLEHARRYPDENIIVTIELFPEELQGLARRVKAIIAAVGP